MKRYECFGHTKTLSEWSKEVGINCCTVRSRLRNGWPLADALTKPVAKRIDRQYKFSGQTKTLPEWSRALGLDYDMLYRRIVLYGWSPEQAFAQPVRKVRKIRRRRALREQSPRIQEVDWPDGYDLVIKQKP